jgi:hypothetical protein
MAMPPSQRLRQEVDLMERFTQTYRLKFASLIDRLNAAADAPSELQCVRLCVEAVNMMLDSHTQVARTLREIASPEKESAPVARAA